MDEQLKERILFTCVIFAVVSLILAIGSGISAQRNKVKFQKEMALRLELEENLENSKFVFSALEEEIKKLQNQVDIEKEARQDIEEELKQEQLVSNALKEELIKTDRLKEILENNLKEALTAKSSKRSR